MRFSTFDIKAPTTYGVIAAGNYDATVSECTWKQNSSGTGEIIAVKFTIIGPSYNNRVVFSNFNIRNSSPRAEEIGQQQFSDFARACGFDRIKDDTDAYVGKVINDYDHKMLFIAAVLVYFDEIKGNVLDRDGKNTVDIDEQYQANYATLKGEDIGEMTAMEIRKYNTGTNVVLAGSVKPVNAMEDLKITFAM